MGLSDLFISAEDLPPGSYGFIQLLFLGAVYANLLMYASNLISDGSELLLLVPSLAGIVGSVVLPILGAVPDGCIVLFSGMGPNAQVHRPLLLEAIPLFPHVTTSTTELCSIAVSSVI